MRADVCMLLVFAGCVSLTLAGELTFELPDNEKQCFFEMIDKEVESTLEFQVQTCITDTLHVNEYPPAWTIYVRYC